MRLFPQHLNVSAFDSLRQQIQQARTLVMYTPFFQNSHAYRQGVLIAPPWRCAIVEIAIAAILNGNPCVWIQRDNGICVLNTWCRDQRR